MALRLAKLFFSIAVWVYDRLQRGFFRIAGKTFPGTCVVLYYHVIRPEERENFARQLDDILKHAEPIRADSKNAIDGDTHYVAITFDDGFVCVLENAVPELVIRNIPFTIFVPTGYLGTRPGWIKDKGSREYQETVMNEVQLSGLSKLDMVTVGSHCVSHSNLGLVDEDSARIEILKSKDDLENIIKQDVKLLSFPHGTYTDRCIDFARQAGYERVFTILPTFASLSPEEFVSGRVSVGPEDWPLEFRLKTLGAYRWLPRAYSLKWKIRSLWK